MQIPQRRFFLKKKKENLSITTIPTIKNIKFVTLRDQGSEFPTDQPDLPHPNPPTDKPQLWLLFTFLNRFSHCSCQFISISEKIGILPALVCLVKATKTNLLLAQVGEDRIYPNTSTSG